MGITLKGCQGSIFHRPHVPNKKYDNGGDGGDVGGDDDDANAYVYSSKLINIEYTVANTDVKVRFSVIVKLCNVYTPYVTNLMSLQFF